MKRFVILAAPRTGSNLLCTLLQSHPDVLCHHELYNPNGIFVALPYREVGLNFGSLAERDADPIKFLDKIWQHPMGAECVGLKITQKDQLALIKAICEDDQIYKIILRRDDNLAAYASYLVAEKTGTWEDYRAGIKDAQPTQVSISFNELIHFIERNQSYYDFIEDHVRGNVCRLEYGSLLDTECQQTLRTFLSLSAYELKPASRKQNPFPLNKFISNWSDLCEEISTHQYARLEQEIKNVKNFSEEIHYS